MTSINESKSLKTAYLGLGVMGYPMAGHLASNGYDVCVFNRTVARSDAWLQQHSGTSEATPAKAAANVDVVFACVGNDNDVEEICCGAEGAFSGMKPGSVFVDHTTASANIARNWLKLHLHQELAL